MPHLVAALELRANLRPEAFLHPRPEHNPCPQSCTLSATTAPITPRRVTNAGEQTHQLHPHRHHGTDHAAGRITTSLRP